MTVSRQANGIIKKLQGDLKALVGKIKVKNTVTVSQEKVLQETTERLQREQRELQDTQHRLRLKEDEVNSFPSRICSLAEACVVTPEYPVRIITQKYTNMKIKQRLSQRFGRCF